MKMKITFFLGAGFSAHFGYPVMSQFFSFADSCPRVTEADRDFMGRLLLESRRANSFLESSATNLEAILSFFEMGERLALTDTDGGSQSLHLKKIIGKIYSDPFDEDKYWNRFSPFKRLVGDTISDDFAELSFITTNYDLNLESACYHLNKRVDPSFKITRPETTEQFTNDFFYEENAIPVFKLHGSVNWYHSDVNEGVLVEDRMKLRTKLDVLGEKRIDVRLPLPCLDSDEALGPPLIVAPSFLKSDLPPALQAVWRGAANALASANILIFVGYSFPPSDTEMMYFLARALADNVNLRKIYLVDPEADRIFQRLTSSRSKMGSHFRDLIEPINSVWRDVRIEETKLSSRRRRK